MTTTTTPPAPTFTRPFQAASFVGFLLLGAVVSLYGPAVPLFRDEFGISTSLAGMALPMNAVATVVGVLAWGAMDRKGRVRVALIGGAVATGVGTATVALAPSFVVVLTGVFAVGFGFGLVDTGINALFSRDRTVGATSRMNVLHAMFGVGAVTFPLILSFVGFRWTFALAGLLMIGVIPALRQATDPGVLEREDDSREARRSARLLLIAFLAIFMLYIGTELGIGNWMAAHLNDQGWSAAAAARWTSGYFAAFTIGRLAIARFGGGIRPAHIVIASLALGASAAGLATIDGVTPYAYVLAGLVIAPVFPTTMVWLSRRLPEERHGPAGAMLAGSLGAAIIPAAMGGLVGSSGTDVVPFAVATVALAATAAAIGVRRSAGSGTAGA